MKITISKIITITLSLIALAISFFPFITIYSGGAEGGTLTVRGFNLMEFTALGAVPLLAPLLVPVILYGHQSKAAKERSLILLLLGNMLCYVHGINSAIDWLNTVGTAPISYHPALIIYPVCFILSLFIAKITETFSLKKLTKINKEQN